MNQTKRQTKNFQVISIIHNDNYCSQHVNMGRKTGKDEINFFFSKEVAMANKHMENFNLSCN